MWECRDCERHTQTRTTRHIHWSQHPLPPKRICLQIHAAVPWLGSAHLLIFWMNYFMGDEPWQISATWIDFKLSVKLKTKRMHRQITGICYARGIRKCFKWQITGRQSRGNPNKALSIRFYFRKLLLVRPPPRHFVHSVLDTNNGHLLPLCHWRKESTKSAQIAVEELCSNRFLIIYHRFTHTHLHRQFLSLNAPRSPFRSNSFRAFSFDAIVIQLI